ncbi:NEAT domain-containing protein [Paenibacillus arenosi]|uniref:NEAT domain-containing protein n=1 Tax=Paenibacillus arenosi TaxID=2774142 RepID=A0ABR9B569_9BACL|nr:NEAT domain-containing protein [Paenibacillus arenosi]MBD8500331.1 NEAT domain-containing protein [Paenibacillus arenosi]
MKKWFKKSALICLTLSLLITLVPVGIVAAASASLTNSSIPNGEYVVDFNFLEDGQTNVSAANTYMKIPGTKGKLIVQNGIIWFEHDIETESFGHFKYLGYRPAGVPKATIVNSVIQDKTGYIDAAVSNGADASRKILRYGISDISKLQDIAMHIDHQFVSYNYSYHAQISIDTSQLPNNGGSDPGNGGPVIGPVTLDKLNELVSVTKSVYDSSVEGPNLGQYPVGSREVLKVAITNAETKLAQTTPGDEAAYGVIHAELNQQLAHFQSLQKQANKAELKKIIASMTTFLSTATANGQANGTPGGGLVGIVEGEYPHEHISGLQERVTLGNKIVGNPLATQREVDNVVRAINSYYDRSIKNRYVASEELRLYVLDTPSETKIESAQASKVNSVVTTITGLANKESLGGARANITLNVTPDENKVYWFMPWDDGTYRSPDLFEQVNMLSAVTIHPNRPLGNTVYQWALKNSDADKDTQWSGLGHITFKVNGEKHSLYLSFNRIIHERLQQSLASAQRKYKDAPKHPNAEQAAFDKAKAELEVAIQEATPISENLNAERPAILQAETKLKIAFDAFKVVALVEYDLYFSTLHASEEAFATVDGKFVKPAQVIPQKDGQQIVRLTITDSSSVKELQMELGGVIKNEEVVSENKAANSRVTQFVVSDLSQFVKAKVKVVTTNQGNSSEATHHIRFNFNGVDNTGLQTAISDASNLLSSAVTGIYPGQYSEAAKTTLSTAIRTAGKIAVNGPNSNDQTASALTALQAAVEAFKASMFTANHLKDGDYNIKFTVLKTDKEEASVLNNFIVSPARLIISGGVKKIFVTIKQSAEIPEMKVNGQNVEVISANEKDNTRVVSFPVADFSVDTKGTAKFKLKSQNNFNDYDFRFRFDNSSVTLYGTGQPPGGLIPGGVLPNGYYHIDFRILKAGTESNSIANTYVVSPALLHVVGNSRTVSFTVKRSKEIHTLTINGSNGSVVSVDHQRNTRAVAYALPTLAGKHNGTVEIDWPEVNYHHTYGIQFVFIEASIKPVSSSVVPGSGVDGNVSGPGLPPPGGVVPGNANNGKKPGEGDKDKQVDGATGGKNEGTVGKEGQTSFGDTKDHWAAKHIDRAVKLGIASGFKDGKFLPNKPITRAEFAAMISRALKLEGNTSELSFKDAEKIPAWASKHISLAVKNGLIVGYKDGTFQANKTMTRAELTVIIARAVKLKLNDKTTSTFADAKNIPAWALKSVTAAVEAGLIQGKANNKFEPNATATRAEAVTLLLRMLDHQSTGAVKK